jgi:hypothetical protein
MKLVRKTIELDQDQLTRIKLALKVQTEKEALNLVLQQFDIDLQLAEATIKEAGTFNFEEC